MATFIEDKCGRCLGQAPEPVTTHYTKPKGGTIEGFGMAVSLACGINVNVVGEASTINSARNIALKDLNAKVKAQCRKRG